MAIRELKRRNASRNESRANWAMFAALHNKSAEVKRLYRADLKSGEITESSRSKMNTETGPWFMNFQPLKTVPALPEQVAWEQMSKGSHFFTAAAEFWIETVPTGGGFYQGQEIERFYQEVL